MDFILPKIIRFPLQRLTLVRQNSNLCRKAGNLASPWKRLIGQLRWVSFYKFETYTKIRDIICLFMLIWKMFPDKHGSGISRLHSNATQECIIEENSTFLNNGRLSLLDQEVHSSQTACVLNLSASSRQRQQQQTEGNSLMLWHIPVSRASQEKVRLQWWEWQDEDQHTHMHACNWKLCLETQRNGVLIQHAWC